MYWFINFVIRVYTRITCRIDAPNLHEFPAQGPLIAIANHTGQIDVPMLFAHLQPRPLTGWAKIESWDNLFLRWVFNTWRAIPIRRGEADMKALKLALKALEEGKIFGLAPEGTRNKTGRLIRAMPGTVIIALHSDAPIIPIAHWGGEIYLKNLKRFKRTDFHIRIGRPFKIKIRRIKFGRHLAGQRGFPRLAWPGDEAHLAAYVLVEADMLNIAFDHIRHINPCG